MLILFCAGIALAQGSGTGGPGGFPAWLGWGTDPAEQMAYANGDTLCVDSLVRAWKFTSPTATSYLRMSGDTLIWTQTGVDADRDFVWRYYDAAGNLETQWQWDRLSQWYRFTDPIRLEANLDFLSAYYPSNDYARVLNISGGRFIELRATGASFPDIRITPYDGGDVELGEAGDGNGVIVQGDLDVNGSAEIDTLRFDSWYGLVRYIDADYTATASDWQICVEDTARVTLPALSIAWDSLTANTGYALQLDIWASTDACTISTVADSIYCHAEIVLSPGDNASLRAGRDFWIVR